MKFCEVGAKTGRNDWKRQKTVEKLKPGLIRPPPPCPITTFGISLHQFSRIRKVAENLTPKWRHVQILKTKICTLRVLKNRFWIRNQLASTIQVIPKTSIICKTLFRLARLVRLPCRLAHYWKTLICLQDTISTIYIIIDWHGEASALTFTGLISWGSCFLLHYAAEECSQFFYRAIILRKLLKK